MKSIDPKTHKCIYMYMYVFVFSIANKSAAIILTGTIPHINANWNDNNVLRVDTLK